MSAAANGVAAIEAAIADFKDPETGRSALQLEQIKDIQVSGNEASLTLAFKRPHGDWPRGHL